MPGRTLLADDMGLGKTIEAIAVSEVMARLYGVEQVLIVCYPTSLKHQRGSAEIRALLIPPPPRSSAASLCSGPKLLCQ